MLYYRALVTTVQCTPSVTGGNPVTTVQFIPPVTGG